MSDKISFREIPLFDGITEEELRALLPCLGGTERMYKKGETILLEQDHVRCIGIVLRGRVHLWKDDIWGGRTLVTFAGPGEMFGENFAVQPDDRSFVTAEAAEDTDALFLGAANIIHTCPRGCAFHARIAENLFRLLGQKSVQLMEKIDIASRGTLREKILAYLSMLAQRQKSRYVLSPLGRAEMAHYLGANRSAMTRELAEMRHEGLIDYDRNTFVLNDAKIRVESRADLRGKGE